MLQNCRMKERVKTPNLSRRRFNICSESIIAILYHDMTVSLEAQKVVKVIRFTAISTLFLLYYCVTRFDYQQK